MNTQFIFQQPERQKISKVQFSVFNDDDMVGQSKVFVRSANVQPNEPASLLDLHMGSSSSSTRCLTCNNTTTLCQGHSGTVQLTHSYILPQFEQYVQQLLKKFCLKCYKITGESKKCPSCKLPAPILKSTKQYKYELYHGGQTIYLSPKQIKEYFSHISLQDLEQLGMGCFPSDLISSNIHISPPMIRPDKRVQGQYRNNDEFTISLQGITKQALSLNQMNENDPMFEKLYSGFTTMLKNYHKGEKSLDEDKSAQTKAVATSLSGKEGKIRNTILAKRINKIGRAVIACDASIPADVVNIPLEFAMAIFIQEVYRPYNAERLLQAFNNGPNIYPGASYIIKADGRKFQIGNPNVILEFGDTVCRHLQNGDYVLMNRQPSLLPMSIGSHKINVSQTYGKDTLDINVITCSQYHADFDGDEMNILFLQNWTSIAEAANISAIHTRIISYVNGKLLISQVQDSVIGGYLLTQDEIKIDLVSAIRMHSNSQMKFDLRKFKFQNGYISGKQALSYVLPEISYTGNSAFYVQGLEKFIQYLPTDKQLKIQLGEIISGYFDYGANEFQKQIALYYDPETTLNIIFSIQQAILNFNKYYGFTIGFKDLLLGKKSKELIQKRKDQMIIEGSKIIQQYTKNGLMNPVEKTRHEYFMERLMEVFFDDGVEAIMNSAGYGKDGQIEGNKIKNNLVNMTITKSKGSLGNMKSMVVQIGQALVDNEPLKLQFQGRLNMFFKKYDQDPLSYGIIMDSYHGGLSPQSMLTNAIPERTQMLQKVLSVAKPGNQGRKMIKNLEPLMVTNTNCVEKYGQVTQFLFGFDGFQVQNLSRYKIPNLFSSYDDIFNKFKQSLDDNIFKQFTKQDQETITTHCKYVADILQLYKECMIRNQLVNNAYQFSDIIQIPIVLDTVVSTVLQQVETQQQKSKDHKNLVENIQQLVVFLDKLKYIYFNDNLQNEKTELPSMYESAVCCIKIAILTCFTLDKLIQLNSNQMSLLLNRIRLSIQYALVEAGTPIGVNVAQAYQEFFTQDLLDAIHKTGTGKQTRNPLDRIIEIFNNKSPQQLQQTEKQLPIIRIPMIQKDPKDVSYEKQRERAEYIASNIKLIQLKNLSEQWQMLLQTLERTDEDTYIMDQEFLKDEMIPEKYTQWCFRVMFDKMKLFLNKISISEIRIALETQFDVYILTSKEDQQRLTMRIYLGNSFTFETRQVLQNIIEQFLEFNVRGLSNIISANVITEKMNILGINNDIIQTQKFVIISEGYNLKDIYRLQTIYKNDINFNDITTDNHYQVMQLYGIGACQQKLVNEIRQLFGTSLDIRHVLFVANEMTQMGRLSSLESDGLAIRNPQNKLLGISESRAIGGLTKGALQATKSIVTGLSANTMVGQVEAFGTEYNKFILNEEFIMNQSNKQSYKDLLSEI